MSNLFNSFSAASTLTDATVFPVVQNGQTRKTTGAELREFVGGAVGNIGATGAAGVDGATGATGAAGVDGATGATGPAGVDGATGAQGSTGATGPAGATGAAGTSVKIIGSTSTESLLPFPYVGQDGDGYIVQDVGDLYVYASNTWTSVGQIVGPAGVNGATGATGPAGLNTPATTSTLGGVIVGHNLTVTLAGTLTAVTSVVSDVAPSNPIEGDQWWDTVLGRGFTYFNGLWIETSPNVGAVGPTGATGAGATGATGSMGATGPQGPAGATGSQGATGATGYQGTTGATGPQGISVTLVGSTSTSAGLPLTGNPGDGWIVTDTGDLWFWSIANSQWEDIGPIVGPQGGPGPSGATGLEGATGATGLTGATGAAGVTGATGPAGPDIYTPETISDWIGTPTVATFSQGLDELASRMVNVESLDLLNLSSSLIPDTDLAYDLGSSDKQWRSLYVGTATIYIGGVPISINTVSNTLVVGTSTNTTATQATNLATENFVVNYLTENINTSTLYNGTLTVALNATGDLLPNTDISQDLGSPTKRFRHVYVGPGSVYIGGNVITESVTGKLVLPGLTRATGYYAEEVDDEDDWGNNPSITGSVTVIDALRYQVLSGVGTFGPNYVPATYTVEKDGNKIEEIEVSNGGGGWTKTQADYARDNNMYATNVADAIDNFDANDWVEIPFRVNVKAEDTEYEDIFGSGTPLTVISPEGDEAQNVTTIAFTGTGVTVNKAGDTVTVTMSGGGNANTGNVVFDNNTLYVGGTGFLNLENSDNQIEIGSNNVGPVKVSVNEGDKAWYFNVDGTLQLPAGGDVVDSGGNSVLGGGNNSYTPEDENNWGTVPNNIQAALDELAARVAALQNYEIDGGNAFTPPQGETIIDGNGA